MDETDDCAYTRHRLSIAGMSADRVKAYPFDSVHLVHASITELACNLHRRRNEETPEY
jgi:hypothetical protein